MYHSKTRCLLVQIHSSTSLRRAEKQFLNGRDASRNSCVCIVESNAEDSTRRAKHQRMQANSLRKSIIRISFGHPISLSLFRLERSRVFDEEFTPPSKIMSLDQSLTTISRCGLYPSISIFLFPERPCVVSHFSFCPSIFSRSFMDASKITMIANSSPHSLTTALHPC